MSCNKMLRQMPKKQGALHRQSGFGDSTTCSVTVPRETRPAQPGALRFNHETAAQPHKRCDRGIIGRAITPSCLSTGSSSAESETLAPEQSSLCTRFPSPSPLGLTSGGDQQRRFRHVALIIALISFRKDPACRRHTRNYVPPQRCRPVCPHRGCDPAGVGSNKNRCAKTICKAPSISVISAKVPWSVRATGTWNKCKPAFVPGRTKPAVAVMAMVAAAVNSASWSTNRHTSANSECRWTPAGRVGTPDPADLS